jgi:4-aminobutyrate aminotransferase-like enzyme/Ser/Thr protein kinase RdoA (MazF antagonist)
MSLDDIPALRAAPPPIDAVDAEALARHLYGIVGSATPLHGERDRNFRLSAATGEFVLKVIDPAADADIVDCQSRVLSHVLEQAPQLPVPRILPTLDRQLLGRARVDGQDYRIRLLAYLPGRLAVGAAGNRPLLLDIGRTLGHLDRALQGFFHVALGQKLIWDVRQAPALLAHADYVTSPALRRLAEASLTSLATRGAALHGLRAQAIHGDFHPANALIDDDGRACSGILDFGDMIHAPLVLEPAVTMAEFLIQGAADLEDVDSILAGYCAVNPLAADDIEMLYELVAARIATALLVHAWRTRHDAAAATATADCVALAESSLGALDARGRDDLTKRWHEAAGTLPAAAPHHARTSPQATPATSPTALLQRRRRLLGAHAELSYATPLHLVRGLGVWVYDAGGKAFLDAYNNVPHVGHSHPAVVEAIRAQASLIATNTRYLHQAVLDYAERLTNSLPEGLDTCLFVNSGSEANDVAWRIARSHTGRGGAVVMTHAYHGITEATTALSPEIPFPQPPTVEWLEPPPGNAAIARASAAELSAAADRNIRRALESLERRGMGLAACVLDSAFTSTGIYDPPQAWMAPIAAAVRDAGGLMIADEVQFGLGRSGSHVWGFARRGHVPDIVTLGKPIGNGYPMGVIITRRSILEKFQKHSNFFSTFGGNPVAAAAGSAVLDVLEREGLMEHANRTGAYFKAQLQNLAKTHPCLGDVRGSGLLLGVDVRGLDGSPDPAQARAIVNGLREAGVLIGTGGTQDQVLKIRPPMVFAPSHVDHFIDVLTQVLCVLAPRSPLSA